MITRQQLEIINRKTLKYPPHIAEKELGKSLFLKEERLSTTVI